MDFPRYKFANESEPELLQFLKVARDAQVAQKNCDLRKYQIWKELLPPDLMLLQKLENSDNENLIVIDESSSDGSLKVGSLKDYMENLEIISDAKNTCSINDIAFAIKENLETLNDLSQSAKENISNCSSDDQKELFKSLNQNLSNEECFYLGESLQTIGSSDIITIFCNTLLIPQLQKEYSERLSFLLENLYNSKYAPNLNNEVLTKLLETHDENDLRIFLQYLNNVQPNYQSTLLRDFIFSTDVLNKNQLFIIEALLNKQLEYEALNKLVEMLSNIAEDHTKDKFFGKLLMNVIQSLGTNVLLLEQPLKHIISGHKSIWKSKLEKTFNTHYEDTLMFSQSFID